MKAIMVMFDSLNREMLEPYGCEWIKTPNFDRLRQESVTFDSNYVASMPCMPARRDLHTGRYNFQHRSWGPIEPFDDSMPELLKNNGIYTHLTTDHKHYWEDGGATYHNRYSSFELHRGQEGDNWKVLPELIEATHQCLIGNSQRNYYDEVNRKFLDSEEKMPQAQTFKSGLDFIDANHKEDNWFLQIETFDPHEPFFSQEIYKKAFEHNYDGTLGDWPPYYPITNETSKDIEHMRYEYAALITMCDFYLGKVLDKMDEYNLWEDTLLIVNTDHGFLLGEHDWWSKSIMPVYEEIAHTPLFIYDPISKIKKERRHQLTQIIDLPVTLLDFFNIKKPKDMQGVSLLSTIANNSPTRKHVLFGYHNAHTNITDGEWVYMRAPREGTEFYEYTLMPTHMSSRFQPSEMINLTLQEPFKFTKNLPTMKIKANIGLTDPINFGSKLFNIKNDPKQQHEILDSSQETEMANAMIKLMKENDCPPERLTRFGFPQEGTISQSLIEKQRKEEVQVRIPEALKSKKWERGAVNIYCDIIRYLPEEHVSTVTNILISSVSNKELITVQEMFTWIDTVFPPEQSPMMKYIAVLSSRFH
ncbi:sulfatase [Streptococcus moroccensis]|uniref:Arylsulfatase A-like enzyme n=1 Tax=Streptococcus moroccensis TaxID=1451356 RepID=A0ABT9YPL9_9STRE|nr:sulfatase [Streptococcus moroccensis]MDQ0221837.1 arylsulfatase A-like enzyme [Streptococcus moroccensis]